MMAVSLTPLVTIMNPGARSPWHYWVPGLGQNALMLLVLRGEALRWTQVLPSFIVGAAMTVAGLAYVAQSMRGLWRGKRSIGFNLYLAKLAPSLFIDNTRMGQ